MKDSGIYKVTSAKYLDRVYVGSAMNLISRWSTHLSYLKHNKHQNRKLQNHFNKYGAEDLMFSTLLYCEKEFLIPYEQFFINILNSYFNICKTARSPLGVVRSQETKQKISDSAKISQKLRRLREQHLINEHNRILGEQNIPEIIYPTVKAKRIASQKITYQRKKQLRDNFLRLQFTDPFALIR